jgi:NADH:ubiquinone oxidoreductase subunit 4 (subunit M)
MNVREFLALAPLAALCLWIGVRPAGWIEIIEPDIKTVAKLFQVPDAPGQISVAEIPAPSATGPGFHVQHTY